MTVPDVGLYFSDRSIGGSHAYNHRPAWKLTRIPQQNYKQNIRAIKPKLGFGVSYINYTSQSGALRSGSTTKLLRIQASIYGPVEEAVQGLAGPSRASTQATMPKLRPLSSERSSAQKSSNSGGLELGV